MSSRFYDVEPSLEYYWRGVILFGRNVASYKFALAKSLLKLANNKSDFIALEDLAGPFLRHIVEHVKGGNKKSRPRDKPKSTAGRLPILFDSVVANVHSKVNAFGKATVI